jgi:hypothetical protein
MPVPNKNTVTKNSSETQKPKMKKRKMKTEKVVKVLSQEDRNRQEVNKMFYNPQTYEGLFYQANVVGSSQAGEVIAMRIRSGYVRKDEVEYLRSKLEGNNNPNLRVAREAFAQVVL